MAAPFRSFSVVGSKSPVRYLLGPRLRLHFLPSYRFGSFYFTGVLIFARLYFIKYEVSQ